MSEPTRTRRLTPKGRATRDRIIDAATGLIAVRGVAGTGIEDVRAAAGVSGSQLYHYFDSRQALIRAVITRQADSAVESPRITALDGFEALQAWADAAVEHQRATGDQGECSLGTLAGELAADEESREDLATGFLRWRDLLLNGLRVMRDRQELRADADLDALAFALLAALQGGVLMSRTLRTAEPLEAAMNAAMAYVRSYATDRG
ncbi:TetR/AcrR family transcriptional regulator [Lentzea sp. NPDC059081]|uniref:TetR/AcrR family transcriptional regulator n=1 Tax=Lentzea sp. NPDC059081 TaxID=3346719 RepID=UPI0036AEE253